MPADAISTGVDMAELNDLNSLGQHLNAATDELNQALESIQQRLNAPALGVEAWLTGPDHELERCLINQWADGIDSMINPINMQRRAFQTNELGYGRVGDGWALLVR